MPARSIVWILFHNFIVLLVITHGIPDTCMQASIFAAGLARVGSHGVLMLTCHHELEITEALSAGVLDFTLAHPCSALLCPQIPH
eukprot:scaffold269764_cov15-Tisochrysis_lutea.AAC.1